MTRRPVLAEVDAQFLPSKHATVLFSRAPCDRPSACDLDRHVLLPVAGGRVMLGHDGDAVLLRARSCGR